MFADLHLHSRFSDGTYDPEDIAGLARKHGLAAVALTDHDTVEGCEAAEVACRIKGVEFINGFELTAEFCGQELHLLGYHVDVHHPALLRELEKFQLARQNRIREIVARLNRLNIPLAAETVFALANCRSPGRPHVGRALIQAGVCHSLDEAFDRFLKKHRAAWVPKYKMSAPAAIDLIHQAGGLAVMAHPGISHCDEAIPEIARAGADGIECFHPKHSIETSARYLHLAETFGLGVTGGSDCHGMSKGKPTIGQVKLPYAYIERLHNRRVENAKAAP